MARLRNTFDAPVARSVGVVIEICHYYWVEEDVKKSSMCVSANVAAVAVVEKEGEGRMSWRSNRVVVFAIGGRDVVKVDPEKKKVGNDMSAAVAVFHYSLDYVEDVAQYFDAATCYYSHSTQREVMVMLSLRGPFFALIERESLIC